MPVNGVAMRTVKIVYPSLLDVGCFSHALDRVGDHFNAPNLSEFWNSWIALFSHSAKAKMLWKEQTGKAMKTYSSTRWWSKWGDTSVAHSIWRYPTLCLCQ